MSIFSDVYHMYVCDPLESELWMVVGHHVGAEN